MNRNLAASWLCLAVIFVTNVTAQTPTIINRSTNIDETIKPDASFVYGLSLERGESAEILVHQNGVDVVVEVRSPAGKLLDSIDSPTGRASFEFAEIFAQERGTYTITVRPFDNREPVGRFRLEVKALRGINETLELLQTRRNARNLATQWLRPRSAEIARSGIISAKSKLPLLDEIAKRVRVIGLGEATHGSREFGDLRFSLTRYLIERQGFRVIAMEASADTLTQLTPYTNGESNLTPAMKRLLESGWIGRRTRREMIDWLHLWNKKHPKDRVQLIGVDAQENTNARKTLRTFLGRAYNEDFMKLWTAAERELAAADEQTAVFGDSGVDEPTHRLLLEIIARLKLDAPILKKRFGESAFKATFESAQILAEFADFNSNSNNGRSRDWYMATRVINALEQKNPSAKVVYLAHNAHIAHQPNSERTTGAILKNVLGCDYAALAVTFGEGSFVAQIPNDLEDRLNVSTLPFAPDESIESVMKELSSGGALAAWTCNKSANSFDTRTVPEWLKTARPMHWIGGLYKPDSRTSEAFRNFNFLTDFDGIIYLPRVTAEDIPVDRPLIPARKR